MNARLIAVARVLVAAFALATIAGCGSGSSVVVRRTGHDRPPSTRVPPPRAGATVVVRKGDTLYRIATHYGISPLDLAMWNRIPPPYTIYPGRRLRLTPPGDARRPVADVTPATPPRPSATPPSTTRPPTSGSSAPQPSGTTASTTKPPVSSSKPPIATPPAVAPVAAAFEWRWPADGGLLDRFVPGDPTRQGIDIGGRGGAPVRAAADGVVVYSGAGLVGYGELIIIKHDEQWLSAYGHNRARLVNEGQRVKAGEQIAEMGRSGASRDMLHFEIRYNGKPQDPLRMLPKR